MKPTSSFKLPKSAKRMLSKVRNPHHRGALRRDYIQAMVESSVKPRHNKEDRNKDAE